MKRKLSSEDFDREEVEDFLSDYDAAADAAAEANGASDAGPPNVFTTAYDREVRVRLDAVANDDVADGDASARGEVPSQGVNGYSERGTPNAELLQQAVTVAWGPKAEAKHGWCNKTQTVGGLIAQLRQVAYGLKDGKGLTQGALVDGADRRRAENVAVNYTLMLDFDTGAMLSEAVARALARSLFAVFWTTHSHGKDVSSIPERALEQYLRRTSQWPGHVGDIQTKHCVAYLRGVKLYLPRVLEGAELIERKMSIGGMHFRVKHQPMPRLRALFVLKAPFDFANRGGSQREAIEEWKGRYVTVSEELGLPTDSTCIDPSRFMYPWRIPGDSELGPGKHEFIVVHGKPYDFDALPYTPKAERASNPFTRVAGGPKTSDEIPANVRAFLTKHKDFRAAEWYRSLSDAEPRHVHEDGFDDECPNSENHSEPDDGVDRAFMILDPGGDRTRCHASCKHITCITASGGDTWWYIWRAMERHGVGVASLVEFSETATAERDDAAAAEKAAENAVAAIERLTAATPPAEVDAILKALAVRPDSYELDTILEKAASNLRVRQGTLRKALERHRTAARQDREAARAAGKDGEGAGYNAKMEEFNRRFAVVGMGSDARIIRFPDKSGAPLEMLKRAGFLELYAPDKVYAPQRRKTVDTAREWMGWRERKTYERAAFDPSNTVGEDTLNFWRGFGVEGRQGDWSLLRRHLFENVCRSNPYWFAWLMSWLANIVQEPGNKPGSAVVAKGLKGTGKTKGAEWVARLAPHNAKIIAKKDQILGRFNAHLAECIFACMEETFWAGDPEAEGVLKDLITGTHQLIEAKGIDPIQLLNHIRIWICSNNDWVVPATGDERRFFVTEVSDRHRQDIPYFKAIDEQMNDGGLAAMMFDLQQLRQPRWVELRTPPATPWLAEQVARSLKVTDQWWQSVLTDGGFVGGGVDEAWPEDDAAVTPDMVREGRMFSGKGAENLEPGWLRISTDNAHAHYVAYARDVRRRAETKAQLGIFLHNIGGKPCRPRGHEGRKNSYDLPPLPELRAAFTAMHGVRFGSDERTSYSNIIPAGLGEDAELKAWECYGSGGGLPG